MLRFSQDDPKASNDLRTLPEDFRNTCEDCQCGPGASGNTRRFPTKNGRDSQTKIRDKSLKLI